MAAARSGQQERQATVPDRLGPAGLALAALAALIACQPPPPGAFGKDDPGRQPAVVRIVRSSGQEQERTSSIAPGERTATPATTVTPTPTTTRSPTPSPTVTPTRQPPTRTPTVTPTATPTPTPRGQAPDLAAAAAGVASFDRRRLRVTGGGPEVLWEVDGPERARVVVYEPARVVEMVVEGGEIFVRRGSYWQRALDTPAQVADRPDRLIGRLGDLRGRPFRLIGPARARAGRCEDWDLTDNAPGEPSSICLGLADRLPYRIVMPDGLTVEPFDFGAPIEVPAPSPLRE